MSSSLYFIDFEFYENLNLLEDQVIDTARIKSRDRNIEVIYYLYNRKMKRVI